MRRIFASVAVVAAATLVAIPVSAQLITAPSNTFAQQYNGDEIWNGIEFVNDWTQAGGATDASLSLNGTTLVSTNDDNNGWVQHDNGSTPWELGPGSYALEASIKLTDNDLDLNDNIVLWAEGNGNRQIIIINADSVATFGGTVLLDNIVNTDGFHTYRINYDQSDATADASGTYQVLRDGVLISGAGIARESGQSPSRLIVGDCCTAPLGNPIDTFEIGYIRYEVIPEPASLALVGMGLVGLTILRRKR